MFTYKLNKYLHMQILGYYPSIVCARSCIYSKCDVRTEKLEWTLSEEGVDCDLCWTSMTVTAERTRVNTCNRVMSHCGCLISKSNSSTWNLLTKWVVKRETTLFLFMVFHSYFTIFYYDSLNHFKVLIL